MLIVGRLSPEATNVRGAGFAAGQKYFRAVDRAGGVPLMLPPMPSLLDRIDALVEQFDAVVLHGGGDIDPRRYGAEPLDDRIYGVVPEHDEVELAIAEAVVRADVPMLAICRGMQVLNVACGGTLVQHIGSEHHWFRHHRVHVDTDSRLATVAGDAFSACHSVHHQALERVGAGLRVVGRASDDTPEAVEAVDARWVVGVQWHPEDSAEHDAEQQRLFDELIRQARR